MECTSRNTERKGEKVVFRAPVGRSKETNRSTKRHEAMDRENKNGRGVRISPCGTGRRVGGRKGEQVDRRGGVTGKKSQREEREQEWAGL